MGLAGPAVGRTLLRHQGLPGPRRCPRIPSLRGLRRSTRSTRRHRRTRRKPTRSDRRRRAALPDDKDPSKPYAIPGTVVEHVELPVGLELGRWGYPRVVPGAQQLPFRAAVAAAEQFGSAVLPLRRGRSHGPASGLQHRAVAGRAVVPGSPAAGSSTGSSAPPETTHPFSRCLTQDTSRTGDRRTRIRAPRPELDLLVGVGTSAPRGDHRV